MIKPGDKIILFKYINNLKSKKSLEGIVKKVDGVTIECEIDKKLITVVQGVDDFCIQQTIYDY